MRRWGSSVSPDGEGAPCSGACEGDGSVLETRPHARAGARPRQQQPATGVDWRPRPPQRARGVVGPTGRLSRPDCPKNRIISDGLRSPQSAPSARPFPGMDFHWREHKPAEPRRRSFPLTYRQHARCTRADQHKLTPPQKIRSYASSREVLTRCIPLLSWPTLPAFRF